MFNKLGICAERLPAAATARFGRRYQEIVGIVQNFVFAHVRSGIGNCFIDLARIWSLQVSHRRSPFGSLPRCRVFLHILGLLQVLLKGGKGVCSESLHICCASLTRMYEL